jgi:hypothetical protein
MTMVGERVVVHEPLFGDRGRLYVFDSRDRELLCEAEPEQSFAWGDPAGAGEQARRKGVLGRKIRRIAAQADPVDPMLAAAATAAEFGHDPLIPGRTIAAAPAPARLIKRPSSLELWSAKPEEKKVG